MATFFASPSFFFPADHFIISGPLKATLLIVELRVLDKVRGRGSLYSNRPSFSGKVSRAYSYPHSSFQRPKPSFKPLEKLEAVDKRNPSLVRAAQVAAVEEYRVKVHFDGWDDIYDDWFDADSFDLHPVGWCEKTGHALEPPLSKYEQRCAFYCFAALLKFYSY